MQLFRDAAPDLVITDIMMPDQEGIETIRLMRGERRQARIVAISGDVPDEQFDILAIARQLGADDALRKPVRPAELLDMVKRLAGQEGSGLA
jgi:CheY-like chemotaxis protein